MDSKGRPTLTRPATPQAFKLSNGRYSFVNPNDQTEAVELPNRLREEKITVREMFAVRR